MWIFNDNFFCRCLWSHSRKNYWFFWISPRIDLDSDPVKLAVLVSLEKIKLKLADRIKSAVTDLSWTTILGLDPKCPSRLHKAQAEARTLPAMEERPLRQVRNNSRQGHRAVAPERKKVKGRLGMFGFFRATCRECKALEPSSQVMEMRSLPAQSAGGYSNGRKINRPGRRPDDVLFELDLKY